MTEPRPIRPHMPGYGIEPTAGGMLPWSWARLRLRDAHDYWISTMWPDGRPHLMPVWGCWDEDGLWFSSSPASRKVRNIEAGSAVTASTDDARNPVVVDGVAELVTDAGAVRAFADATNTKYRTGYAYEFFEQNALVLVRPRSVFGLADGRFTESPTRWVFDRDGNHAGYEQR
jgi:PPOX class probable F420-dependent enzyme